MSECSFMITDKWSIFMIVTLSPRIIIYLFLRGKLEDNIPTIMTTLHKLDGRVCTEFAISVNSVAFGNLSVVVFIKKERPESGTSLDCSSDTDEIL